MFSSQSRREDVVLFRRMLMTVVSILCTLVFQVTPVRTFSWDDPPGPQFTAEQKQEQIQKGKSVVADVMDSFVKNASSHIIAPGNYRWLLPDGPTTFQVSFQNMTRPADNPFTIVATGVTFWISPMAPTQTLHASFGVQFLNCSHIHVVGLTLDGDPRGVIEGKVVQVDIEQNRIRLSLTNGSYPFQPFIADPAAHNFLRFLPYKFNGDFMGPLYAFQHLDDIYFSHLSELDSQGMFWATLRTPRLLTITNTTRWKAAYGNWGVIEPNDGISILVTRAKVLELENSAAMVFDGLTNYMAKGSLHLTVGDGGHSFQNTLFSRRPSTNQLYGGDGVMVNAVRRGPVFDNFTVVTSSDDIINFHSYWGYVNSVHDDVVVFERSSFNLRSTAVLRPGDEAVFYNNKTFEKLGTLVFEERLDVNIIRFNDSTAAFANSIAFFPQWACENWAMRNSKFLDCYQRVLIQAGSGEFVNNRMEGVGSAIVIRSTPASHNEGGVPGNILIANNTIVDTATAPYRDRTMSSPIHIGVMYEPKLPIYDRIHIINNTIIRPGDTGINMWTASRSLIIGNSIVDPHYITSIADPNDGHAQGIFVAMSQGITVSGNNIHDSHHVCIADNRTGSAVLGLGENNANITFNGKHVCC
eukprot:scpid59347/ scgid13603/ 